MMRAARVAGHVVAAPAADATHVHFHLPDSIKEMSPEQLAALTGGSPPAAGAAAGAAVADGVGRLGGGEPTFTMEEVAQHATKDEATYSLEDLAAHDSREDCS